MADTTQDRPLLGILLMTGFCVVAPLGDGMAKLLGVAFPILLLVLVRFGVQFALLAPVCLLRGLTLRKGRRLFWLIALRTCLHIAGISLMFSALLYLPLADAIAIAFVMPFIMLLLGWLVLGEAVGPHRLGACAVGFVGTLLVIQPNFAEVGLPALLPLGVALVFALFMLVTRMVARDLDPIALQTISGAQALVILLPIAWLWLDDPWAIVAAQPPGQLWLLAGLGVLGTLAHLLMTWSLRFAPSATLAPMQYLEIPVGTVIGWLIFSDWPNGLAAVGIGITVAAGLYVIARERAIARMEAAPTAP